MSKFGEGFEVGEGEIVGETEKGIFVRIPEISADDIFVPESQIHEDSELYSGAPESTGTLVVSQWLAEQRGWA